MKKIQSIVMLLTLCAVALGFGKQFHEESTIDGDSEDGESVFVRLDHPPTFPA